ncbi:MAG: glycosyltransferase family 39 protein [Thermoanaerobaculia bacterium]
MAGTAGALLLALAGVVNLHLLGLAEWVRPQRGRLLVELPGSAAPVEVPFPGVGAPLVAACLAGVAVLAAGGWFVVRRSVLVGRLGRALRDGDRRGLAVAVALLAVGFVPIGLLRSLAATYAFYLAAVPGFLLLLYATWPGLHRVVDGAVPRFERIVFGCSPRLFAAAVFTLTLGVASGLSWLLFDFTPRIPTGIAHRFHAGILASGSLYAEAPPLPEFFYLATVVTDAGRWFSQFPLGHTSLVAAALKLGAPWIVNPLCGAAAVVLFYLLGRELFGERTGRLAAVFGVLSPFLVFLSAEFYNNASSLVFCTAFLLFFARLVRLGRVGDGLLAGLFLGLVLHVRPVTAVAVSLPCVVWSLLLLRRSPRRYAAPLAAVCVVTLALAGLLLASNYGITGEPLTLGYAHEKAMVQDRAFDLSRAVPNTVIRLRLLNRYLFQWAVPSLVPIALLFAAGRARRWDYLLLSLVPSGLLLYAAWYHLGHELGPRYLYFTLGTLAILSVRGFQALPGFAARMLGEGSPLARRSGAATVAAACFLSAALLTWVPLAELYGSDRWWGLDRSVVERVEAAGLADVLVFVPDGVYRSVFLDNAVPVHEGDVIYARDLGERNAELMQRFPDRSYYRMESGTLIELESSPVDSSPGGTP